MKDWTPEDLPEAQKEVYDYLAGKKTEVDLSELETATGKTAQALCNLLSRLVIKGMVVRTNHGTYRTIDSDDTEEIGGDAIGVEDLGEEKGEEQE